jgi:periplasmic protein TonB
VQPKFPREDVKKYIADSIRYPQEARKEKIEGTVYLDCVIERDGSVSITKVLQSPDSNLTNEAKRVVTTMKWSPGKRNGVPIRVQYIFPVSFKL